MVGSYLWVTSLMLFGAGLLYWRKKRKFDRLNKQGIEVFGSYLEKFKADTFNTLLLWVGNACLISSLIVFLMMG